MRSRRRTWETMLPIPRGLPEDLPTGVESPARRPAEQSDNQPTSASEAVMVSRSAVSSRARMS